MTKSKKLHIVGTLAAIALIAGTAFAASPAFAAKGGGHHGGGQTGGTAPSITLDQTDPHLGDSVTFTTTGGTVVQVACYAGTGVDYVAVQPAGTAFLLGGTDSAWLASGGSATCYAYLGDSHGYFTSTMFAAGGAR